MTKINPPSGNYGSLGEVRHLVAPSMELAQLENKVRGLYTDVRTAVDRGVTSSDALLALSIVLDMIDDIREERGER
jgi:hypothetical protein